DPPRRRWRGPGRGRRRACRRGTGGIRGELSHRFPGPARRRPGHSMERRHRGRAGRGSAMIDRLIDFSLRHRYLILGLALLTVAAGLYTVRTNPIDAVPDISERQVIVFADWPGRSPQEVEDQVTFPLTANLQGLAGVKAVRASSAFGLSMVTVIFADGTDLYFGRQRIRERMNLIQRLMPQGVVPALGPDASAVGQVFWYTLDGKGYDLGQLRSLQDWFVRYQLSSVPGVAEVASIGGFVR